MNKQYHFSVEGYNEKWYLEHLKKLINTSAQKNYSVDFDIKIDKSPKSRMKSLTKPVFGHGKIQVYHFADYESNEKNHQQQFHSILDELKEIKQKHSNYKFHLGYSNFAFELWLLLHKNYNFAPMSHRKDYIAPINEAYETNFIRMKDNKRKKPFDNLLTKINLQDVKNAINRAENIRPSLEKNGNTSVEYKGFRYFRENPDLTIHECIKKILEDCGLFSDK